MARTYALRSLAQRFPADTAAGLNPADRQVLNDLARAHLAALAGHVASIQRTLAPVLVSLGGSPAQGRPVTAASTWQDASVSLLQASKRTERLMTSVLGATQDSEPPERVPSDLMAAMSDLEASLQQIQGLVP
jgi:hypothetical protein